jgi:hypothetical protein
MYVYKQDFGLEYAARYLVEKFAAGHHLGKSTVISLDLQQEGKRRLWSTILQYYMRCSVLVLQGLPSLTQENCLLEGTMGEYIFSGTLFVALF